jgi:hypothetical protein
MDFDFLEKESGRNGPAHPDFGLMSRSLAAASRIALPQ